MAHRLLTPSTFLCSVCSLCSLCKIPATGLRNKDPPPSPSEYLTSRNRERGGVLSAFSLAKRKRRERNSKFRRLALPEALSATHVELGANFCPKKNLSPPLQTPFLPLCTTNPLRSTSSDSLPSSGSSSCPPTPKHKKKSEKYPKRLQN